MFRLNSSRNCRCLIYRFGNQITIYTRKDPRIDRVNPSRFFSASRQLPLPCVPDLSVCHPMGCGCRQTLCCTGPRKPRIQASLPITAHHGPNTGVDQTLVGWAGPRDKKAVHVGRLGQRTGPSASFTVVRAKVLELLTGMYFFGVHTAFTEPPPTPSAPLGAKLLLMCSQRWEGVGGGSISRTAPGL